MSFTTSVKLALYDAVATTTRVPSVHDIARTLDAELADVQAAFDDLHKQKLIVPEPGDPTRVRMAPPFAGNETKFRVLARGKSYYANCVWDSLGIPAALQVEDAVIHACDGHTGEPMMVVVKRGRVVEAPCTIHFEVPMAHAWDDIIFT